MESSGNSKLPPASAHSAGVDVPHKLRNVLAVVMGRAQLMKTMITDEKLLRHLEFIESAAKQGLDLTSLIDQGSASVAEAPGKYTSPAPSGSKTGSASKRIEAAPQILLVEDEAQVRAILTEMLGFCGQKVLCADSAEAAVDLINNSSGIKVVISDITLPGEDGWWLAQYVRQHRPDLKFVVLSGVEEAAISLENRTGIHCFLNKPCDLSVLKGKLSEWL